ncbi:MAG: L-threonylcarbamoyladenylate synthase [bacterium]|nr:L-threonylcarbamoyladenylate synthase [bacterium]
MSYVTRTRIYPVDPHQPAPGIIDIAAQAIRDGRLVAFPTETVYGLGAKATDADAVARIFAAKQRPTTDPIIVHIASVAALEGVAVDVPALAYTLAAQFWPGALTLVLRRADLIPANVSAGRTTVAVRMPDHSVARALIEAAGLPIAAPSANTFSRPSATTAAHVLHDLEDHVDVILNGGAARIGLESTVLDLTGSVPIILRPGGVTLEALRTVIPNLQVRERFRAADETADSPGELLRHYAPNAALYLLVGDVEQVNRYMRDHSAALRLQGVRVGILAPDEEADAFRGDGVPVVALGSRGDLAGIGHGLFAHLREIDRLNVDVILIRAFPREGLGAALWDRLVRAAEGRVIDVR